jgi:glycosyltransferase involved in cell wall biosynthesis
VSSKYLPEYSGSGLRAHRTYLRLKEKFNIDSEVISSSTEINHSEQYEIDGTQVERIVSPRWRQINRRFATTPLRRLSNALLTHSEARSVRRVLLKKEFDVIHTFGYSPATAAAIAWSRAHNIPLIVELVNPVATPYQYLPGTRFYSHYDLRKQSIIVAISKSLGDMCQSRGLTENVWVRPNPVDTSRFSAVTDSVKQTARQKISTASSDDVLIVYVAKYIARKNHSFLLDVLTKLPDRFKMVLAGPPLADRDLVKGFTAKQIPLLRDRADELGVGDRVEITHGFVDMVEYLSAADVFCFPAVDEAMGTPILESISMGVPVVANGDESSFQEWITEGTNGFLRPLQPDAWAEAIVEAAKFSNATKMVMSSEIRTAISTDSIDEQYSRILNAIASSSSQHTLNVSEILSS